MKAADEMPPQAAGQMDVSIVMPCLNEERGVAECVRKALDWIGRSGMKGEVIVVDNGSTDRSAAVAEEAGARVIEESERGSGAPLDEGYDLVMGNRLTDQLAKGAMPWAHRVIGTPLISWMLRLFTGAKITDSQCGLRAMRRQPIQELNLRSPGMEFASEMILKAMRQGLRMTEVPISYDVRTGESKLSTLRDGWRHLRFLLVSSPSYVFLGPGFLCLLL